MIPYRKQKEIKVKLNLFIGVALLFTLNINADDIEENMSYQQMGVTYNEYTLYGKDEECSITYIENKKFASTTCVALTNSKKVKILCTKNKNMCKTYEEVSLFVYLGEEINKEKISKTPPFVGRRIFNFAGGSGTVESIKINRKSSVTMELHGKLGSEETFAGTYKEFLKKFFIYEKTTICTRGIESAMECTKLENLDKEEKNKEPKVVSKKSNKDKTHSMCSSTINADVFRKTNPYKLKGKCVEGRFKISNVLSENTAFGFILLKNFSLRTMSVVGEETGKRAVHLTAKGKLSDSLIDGGVIQGTFKITGTEKFEMLIGGEITANSLLWLHE